MPLRLWLQEGLLDDEPGFRAWALDYLGFATWAPTRSEVLARVPIRLTDYLNWRTAHGMPAAPPSELKLKVVEQVRGNEVLFSTDREAATLEEIDLTRQLLAYSREDLLREVAPLDDATLDFDPPYANFASWADWRSIRAILIHVANCESHYYTRRIGYQSPWPRATVEDDWREVLARSRTEAVEFLAQVKTSSDRTRVSRIDWGIGPEEWSAKKVLRRMVWHELLHWKSIRRIIGEYHRRAEL
jgi:hypothetical protein